MEERELQSIHTRAPASELYWAVIASLVDDGTANANVLRRDAPGQRTLDLVNKGKQSVCDPFWLAKIRAGPLWVSNATAPTSGEPLASSTIDAHTGLPMTAALDILRHLWFRGSDSLAPAHAAVWRHPDSTTDTAKHLQKHVKILRIKIVKVAIYSVPFCAGRPVLERVLARADTAE